MSQLMGNERHERTVSGKDRGRDKGERGVFHPAKRKARRKYEEIGAPPAITAKQRFDRSNHRLDIGKLIRRRIKNARLGPHAAAVPQGPERQIPDGQGNQV
jgi:hypothetical protein